MRWVWMAPLRQLINQVFTAEPLMKLSMPRFDQAAVLVVGDVMLDRYWHGGTSRISPEAPVPVVKVEHVEEIGRAHV